MLRIVGATFTALLLVACAPTTLSGGPSAGHLQANDATKATGTIPQPVQQSVPLPRPKAAVKTETYSVVVNNVNVHDLLFALARDAKLNVDIHPGISGTVTLNAIDQTLQQLLTRISKQVDMRFELDGPNLAVMPDSPYLKTYKIDYVNMSRETTGTVAVTTQIATAGGNTTPGTATASGGGNNSQTLRIFANVVEGRQLCGKFIRFHCGHHRIGGNAEKVVGKPEPVAQIQHHFPHHHIFCFVRHFQPLFVVSAHLVSV